MWKPKQKIVGGREYTVIGSTIEYEGIQVVRASYTTTIGKVVVEKGRVTHPDGTKTKV